MTPDILPPASPEGSVYFVTSGRLDLTALTLMGASVKVGASPIGYFGTGLKYALAVLAREGLQVEIQTQSETFRLGLKPASLRGQEFLQPTLAGDQGTQLDLPFTTELGKNWGLREAFRELYSNTLDEGGTIGLTRRQPNTSEWTIIAVGGMEECFLRRGEVFLDTSGPSQKIEDEVEVYPGASPAIYYRGVAVYRAAEGLFQARYNVLQGVRLTEDRTAPQWSLGWALNRAILVKTQDPEIIREYLRGGASKLATERLEGFSPQARKVVEELYDTERTALAGDYAEAIRLQRLNRVHQVAPATVSSFHQDMLQGALRVLKAVGLEPTHEVVLRKLPPGVMGLAQDNKIWLSPEYLQDTVFDLARTIIEEEIHLTSGTKDETRAFEVEIFEVVKKLLKKAYRRTQAQASQSQLEPQA